MYAAFSGVFFPNRTQQIKMEQNKSLRTRFYLAFGLCGPFVWLVGTVMWIGRGIGWFMTRSSSWFKGEKFLTHEDEIKIEKIKALFNN